MSAKVQAIFKRIKKANESKAKIESESETKVESESESKVNTEPDSIFSYEEILDRYKENNELNKFVSFDESDFFNDSSCPVMLYLMNLFNETVFSTNKILIPSEVRTIFGSLLGIFNFEFSNYLIIHKNRKLIFDLKINKLINAKTLQELKDVSTEICMFLSYECDLSELDSAIENKEFIKLEYLKSSIKQQYEEYFNDLLNEGIKIDSIEEFVCCSNTLYYEGSFLMNAKKLFDELFSEYPSKLTAKQKYSLLLHMYKKNIKTIKFEDIKTEIINQFKSYYDVIFASSESDSEENIEINLSDNFYNELSNTLVCFIIQFIKEVSIEAMFNNKNIKLRIKNSNIIEIMRGMCPRDEMYSISQINFLRYISYTRNGLDIVLNKRYGYITSESSK